MPYAVRRKGRKFQVVNADTGEVKAESTSKAKAQRQQELLNGLDKGWTQGEDETYTRTINGKTVRLKVTGTGVKNGKAD